MKLLGVAVLVIFLELLSFTMTLVSFHVSEDVIDMCQPHSSCAEVGVWKGEVSKAFAKRRPQTLYLIDPWEYQAVEFPNRWFSGKIAKSQHDMDVIFQKINKTYAHLPHVTIIREKSAVALQSLKEDSLDFLYIDGNHEYAPVLADLRNARRVVKPGGIIAGDDYHWTNDTNVPCVKEAVAYFSKETGLKPTIHVVGGVQFSFVNKKGRPEAVQSAATGRV